MQYTIEPILPNLSNDVHSNIYVEGKLSLVKSCIVNAGNLCSYSLLSNRGAIYTNRDR